MRNIPFVYQVPGEKPRYIISSICTVSPDLSPPFLHVCLWMLQCLDFASTNSSFVLVLCTSTNSSCRSGYAGINFHNHMELTQWICTPHSPR